MKRHILTVAMLLLTLALPLPAMAAKLTGGTMSVDLPARWTGVYHPADNNFLITAPDEICFIFVRVVDNKGGKSIQEWSQTFANVLNGTEPKKISDNYYYFFANVDGVDMTVDVRTAGSKILAYAEFGDPTNFAEDIKKIKKSFKSTNKKEQAVLNLLKE